MGLLHSPLIIFSIILSVSSLVNAELGYQKLARTLHNQYRAKHGARPLNTNEDLNTRAVRCAQYYANKGKIDHTCPYKAGSVDNLYMSPAKLSNDDVARRASTGWYNEKSKHNFGKNDFQYPSGHFSQMVWKATNKFGFGVAQSSKGTVGVALYRPRGNNKGQFLKNVARA